MILINKARRKPRIDMVPLIDVLMVLIIFFLVTMQFKDLRALNVKLPKIETAGSNLIKNELIILIQKTASMQWMIKRFPWISYKNYLPQLPCFQRSQLCLLWQTKNHHLSM